MLDPIWLGMHDGGWPGNDNMFGGGGGGGGRNAFFHFSEEEFVVRTPAPSPPPQPPLALYRSSPFATPHLQQYRRSKEMARSSSSSPPPSPPSPPPPPKPLPQDVPPLPSSHPVVCAWGGNEHACYVTKKTTNTTIPWIINSLDPPYLRDSR